ncbi:hypothetical protein C922_00851 [Plasmodium inui San Antonio 1]|uniref:Uncharacterized protein n=1 Tax=Plasmodium inui San Antonio 1 TaxID=1237626 RepID=W7A9S4_9APIC|nr:hypothetical protein C922_00851 [Plasmodium inui San Antonio 1]EUD68455.1 hypothetical protein C922_00851 [Plasmodium inui San Antonio 1]
MSVSSQETICSYSSGGSRLGAAGEAGQAGQAGEAKETHGTRQAERTSETSERSQTSGTSQTSETTQTSERTQTDITHKTNVNNRVAAAVQPRERGRPTTPAHSSYTRQTALGCALGRISSNYVIHASNNTSVAGEWGSRMSASTSVNLCRVTKLMSLCEDLPASAAYLANGTDGGKRVEEMAQKSITPVMTSQIGSHQVRVTHTEPSCETGPENDGDTNMDTGGTDHMDERSNSIEENSQLEQTKDPSDDHHSTNKRVFIQGIRKNYQTNGNTFTYLKEVIQKTYKETVELDGSEYIFLYDICVQDGDVYSQLNEKRVDCTQNGSWGGSAAIGTTELEEENDILALHTYNKYRNLFHTLSNQLNRISRLIYPVEGGDMSRGCLSTGSLSIVGATSNGVAHNYADNPAANHAPNHAANHAGRRTDGRQSHIEECRMVGGFDDTSLESIQNLFAEETQRRGIPKGNLLERLNCIFFSSMGTIGKESDPTAGDNSAKGAVNRVDGSTANPVGRSTANPYGDSTSNSVGDCTPNSASPLNASCSPRRSQLTPLDMAKITQHMKASANRRVHESDIYDIEILKKGYFYLYIGNEHWDDYYCVFFHLKNNLFFKNDLLYTHYCRVYDRGMLSNVLIPPDSYSNFFIAFFKDDRFEMDRMSNLELAIRMRRNYYPFVIELSRSKKTGILIHTGQDAHRVRSSLIVFDINSDPFYLIPIECFPEDRVATMNVRGRVTKGEANESSRGGTPPPRARVKLHYGLLKEWNEFLGSVMERSKHGKRNLCHTQRQSEKTHYVNRKFSQWIRAFKKERNIQEGRMRVSAGKGSVLAGAAVAPFQ